MRTISRATRFKKDFKRELRGRYRDTLNTTFLDVLRLLATDHPLPASLFDHALTGEWQGYRDCHIKPDFILIYRKVGTELLELARLGSHSELAL